ncbi:hypothetical protein CEXT_664581 [Caerostris extrusa]|uniref:Uncharacterized protein n=1 Tax=Caerostris extrusa TaxID=172846 RepID=A0AAV4WS95_CAEEX|nr:hypothetical protein CEXT_664581 [Caerostris extrusa]
MDATSSERALRFKGFEATGSEEPPEARGPASRGTGRRKTGSPQLRHHLRRQSLGASRPGASRHAFRDTPPSPTPRTSPVGSHPPPSLQHLLSTLVMNKGASRGKIREKGHYWNGAPCGGNHQELHQFPSTQATNEENLFF